MLKRIASLLIGAAACGAVVLPQAAAAADYDDGGGRPFVYRSRDDIRIDRDGARIERRQDLRAGERAGRRDPGPVAFDERDPDRGDGRPGYRYGDRDDVYRRPVIVDRPAYGEDGPAPYGPGFGRPYGVPGGFGAAYRPVPIYRSGPPYRAVSVPVYGEGYGSRVGLTDVGCTIEQAQSTTPAGWRKIVTHRTCYRR